jgi:N-methylhydantoinase A
MLERKGARVAFVTNAGFEDTIAIGRQTRRELYNWFAPAPACLAPEELRFGAAERVSAQGELLVRPTDEELRALAEAVGGSGAEAVAVSLLFSFANPETEKRMEAALKATGLPVSVSHRILPEFREYERASTTVVNAYLAPRMEHYLDHLERRVTSAGQARGVHVMQSSGGIIPARRAAREPVRTVLSGPAGGVIGACRMALLAGFDRILGIDMGGTSTDVFLAADTAAGARLTRESVIAGVPIGVPMLDIHTVGAGGGSIARFDAGGMLRVGPESAGADPGPVCFGRGSAATVTDANLILGRMDEGSFLGGGVALDRVRAERMLDEQKGPLKTAEGFASGILRVVETRMESAMRLISVERGHDPRDFTLVAFGGGGPLHACALARALRMTTVLIPAMPGALSALGILLADTVRDYSRTVMRRADGPPALEAVFAELEEQGRAEFAGEDVSGDKVQAQRSLDIRYLNQSYELNLRCDSVSTAEAIQEFHRLHRQLYGFSHPDKPVEIVNLRLRLTAPAEQWAPRQRELRHGDARAAPYAGRGIVFDGRRVTAGVYRRDALTPGDTIAGPALITEYTSATLLPPGCQASVDGFANLILAVPRESEW